MKTKLHLLALALGVLWIGDASAKLWDVSLVQGCDPAGGGGFCASVFHASTSSSAMSGAILGDIIGVDTTGATDVLGTGATANTYDDVSGAFDAGFTLSNSGNNTVVRLTSSLSFDAPGSGGLMNAVSSLKVAFDGTPLYTGTDDDLFFNVGVQCCAGPFNPNSFLVSGSPFPVGGNLMTIWGANGWDSTTSSWPNSTLGVDLRLYMVEAPPGQTGVPEPASLALVVLGIAGLGLRRRRNEIPA